MRKAFAASRASSCAPFPERSFTNFPMRRSAAAAPALNNIDQPEIAASLGEKKAKAVIATDADVVVSGNIGCLTQLRVHLARLGSADSGPAYDANSSRCVCRANLNRASPLTRVALGLPGQRGRRSAGTWSRDIAGRSLAPE